MRIRVHRSDGKVGVYSQDVAHRAEVLIKRLDPATLFTSGPIVIGIHNPFSILNPDEVCWVEVESELPAQRTLPPGIQSLRMLAGREEYEALLAGQWPQWRKFRKGAKGDLLEALVELSLRGGGTVFLHVVGVVEDVNLAHEFFGVPAITASLGPDRVAYINARCIVRARVYHSKDQVEYPSGIWFADADDI